MPNWEARNPSCPTSTSITPIGLRSLELTRELIANEEADATELKRLRKEMRDFEDTTLWALLVDTMQLDTAKHLTLLRFVERHATHRL